MYVDEARTLSDADRKVRVITLLILPHNMLNLLR
jgi:hypothetical protein